MLIGEIELSSEIEKVYFDDEEDPRPLYMREAAVPSGLMDKRLSL